jgi:hypothetical protein
MAKETPAAPNIKAVCRRFRLDSCFKRAMLEHSKLDEGASGSLHTSPAAIEPGHLPSGSIKKPVRQSRQLGDVYCDPPRQGHARGARRFSFLTFLSLAILARSDGDLRKRCWRASATMLSAFHDILLVCALALAGALTAAWDGLLGYGLFKLMSTVF